MLEKGFSTRLKKSRKHLINQFVDRVILFKHDVEVTLKILVTIGGGGPFIIVTKVKKHKP